MARLILFSAGCLTANLPSFCQPHSWSLIRHCARTVVAAGGHLVCLHSPGTKWQKQSAVTCAMPSNITLVTCHERGHDGPMFYDTSHHRAPHSSCLAVDCPIAWQHEISWPELAQRPVLHGEEGIWSGLCLTDTRELENSDSRGLV